MAPWRVDLSPSAADSLATLPRQIQVRLAKALRRLSVNPYSAGDKLHGRENRRRLRVAQYRVVYAVHSAEHLVTVTDIGHRREIYRGF